MDETICFHLFYTFLLDFSYRCYAVIVVEDFQECETKQNFYNLMNGNWIDGVVHLTLLQ